VKGALDALVQATEELVADMAAPYEVSGDRAGHFRAGTAGGGRRACRALQQHPLNVGSLLNFHFELRRFQKLVEALSDHSLFDVQTFVGAGSDVDAGDEAAQEATRRRALACANVAPAWLPAPAPADPSEHHAVLGNVVARRVRDPLLGLPEDTGWIDVPPASRRAPEPCAWPHEISTRYAHRDRSLQRLVAVIATAVRRTPRQLPRVLQQASRT